jgi:hypothetical protein
VAERFGGHSSSWRQTSTRPVPVVVAPALERRAAAIASAPASVTEWTIIVETPPRAAPTTVELGAFRRALQGNPAARDPAASFDLAAGALAAQFQVVAESREAAALRGCFAYWGAVAAAGVAVGAESTVLVAPLEDAGRAERFSVSAHARRI